jgi:prolyl oligopeptidase
MKRFVKYIRFRPLPIILCIGISSLTILAQTSEDQYQWLEDIEGVDQLNWVDVRNQRTLDYLQGIEGFAGRYDFVYNMLTSDEKLAYPLWHNNYTYNFWQDEVNSHGIWRRKFTTDFIRGTGNWEILLDLDSLSHENNISWAYKGVQFAGPESNRCILMLSEGGSDAARLMEFDVAEKRFVTDGFNVSDAKSYFAWISESEIYVATDFGDGSVTNSGYPRIIKRWERNTPLSEAEIVFETVAEDMVAAPEVVRDNELKYELIYKYSDYYNVELYILIEGLWISLDLPANFTFNIVEGQAIIHTLVDWEVSGVFIKEGDVVSIELKELLSGNFKPKLIFTAGERVSVENVYVSGNKVLINTLNSINSELFVGKFSGNKFEMQLLALPSKGSISIVDFGRNQSGFALVYESFNQPSTLYIVEEDSYQLIEIRRLNDYFDANAIIIEQYEAISDDSTKIPYFLVHSKSMERNGQNPTLLSGYGGFQVSELPYYSATLGKMWLEQGGVFVLANIRGGGEFGPAWHTTAIRENKQVSFDDFIAVAEDLIERKITSPRRLGIYGGSNGGLLVGAVMVQRPELFNAVACFVPLLDMGRYSKLLAGNSWIAEYGDPEKPEDWNYISKYSPYQNVKEGEYPTVLFLTSTRDDRVHPGHARKMTAKMEDLGHTVYLFENMKGGHGASYMPAQKAMVSAMYYTFFTDQLLNQ